MIILDLEASGVDEIKHSILSVGAFDFDHPENQFYEECRVWDGARIDNEALALNGFTREQAVDKAKQTDEDLIKHFMEWTKSVDDRTFVGQNPSFDRDFLHRTADRYNFGWPFAYRTIDLHSACFALMIKRGVVPPVANNHSDLNSEKIMKYVGLPVEPLPHNALMGAKVAGEALSRLLYGKNLLPEFKDFPVPAVIVG